MMRSFFNKKTACLALFLILFFSNGLVPGLYAGAEDELQKAEKLSKDMLYEDAVKILNDFIRANVADPVQKTKMARAHYLLARIYFDVDERDPQVRGNLQNVFKYDADFSTDEINAAFRKLVEEVRGNKSVEVVQKVSKMKLRVEVAKGAGGSPASGTYTYDRGKRIRYNYNAKKGAGDVTVVLDEQSVPAKGTVTMDQNHTLIVRTADTGSVVVDSDPAGADIIVDGVNSGHKTGHTFTYTTPGSHSFILRKPGYKEYETTINVEIPGSKTVSKDLERGLNEEFNTGAASSVFWRWETNPAGKWTITDGGYQSTCQLPNWNYSIYNFSFPATKFTVIVKMKRLAGRIDRSNGIAIITGTNPNALSGYLFNYTTEGQVSIWNMSNYNINTAIGRITAIGPWGYTTAVNKGTGIYNTIKIVKEGNMYTYYLNNIKVYSFSDSTHNPGYILIGGDCGGQATQMFFDYVSLIVGN